MEVYLKQQRFNKRNISDELIRNIPVTTTSKLWNLHTIDIILKFKRRDFFTLCHKDRCVSLLITHCDECGISLSNHRYIPLIFAITVVELVFIQDFMFEILIAYYYQNNILELITYTQSLTSLLFNHQNDVINVLLFIIIIMHVVNRLRVTFYFQEI